MNNVTLMSVCDLVALHEHFSRKSVTPSEDDKVRMDRIDAILRTMADSMMDESTFRKFSAQAGDAAKLGRAQ